MRLDLYLAEQKYYASRTRAVRAIQEGCVRVNGKVIFKPAYELNLIADEVECASDPVPYVGRGALKLAFALDKYAISVNNFHAIDIGASTGGFTDVLLQRGAAHVVCVDVGHGQLADKIKHDPRTSVFEDMDIRNFTQGAGTYEFACADVSFISIKKIIPHIYRLLKPEGLAVCLVKPQFEVGRKHLNKKGIVKDLDAAAAVLPEIEQFLQEMGFTKIGSCISPIQGGDGNTEYLCVCRRK